MEEGFFYSSIRQTKTSIGEHELPLFMKDIMAKNKSNLHKKEEKVHEKTEKLYKEDKKIHDKLEKKHKKEKCK